MNDTLMSITIDIERGCVYHELDRSGEGGEESKKGLLKNIEKKVADRRCCDPRRLRFGSIIHYTFYRNTYPRLPHFHPT